MFSRRNFLKALGIGAGAAAVGGAALAAKELAELKTPTFVEAAQDPYTYGQTHVTVTDDSGVVYTHTANFNAPDTLWQRTDGTYTTDRALLSMWSK